MRAEDKTGKDREKTQIGEPGTRKGVEQGGWGRQLWAMLGIFLAGLVLLGGIIVAVDPFFHYHKPLRRLAYSIDSERYQNDGISRHFIYDAVLAGTSMTENFKTSQFDRLFGATSIRIPYGGAYYKEVDEAVRQAVSYHPRIEMVFRSLDKSFLMYDKDAWNTTAPASDYLNDRNLWNDMNYIWNKGMIFGNVRGVFAGTRAGGRTTTFDKYMHWAPDKEWGEGAVLETFDRPDLVKEPVPFTQEDRELVRKNVEQNILTTARTNPDITFCCFIPPYSTAYWHSRLIARDEFERQLSALRLMTDMLTKCDNIRLFGFDDQFSIICDLDNYMDVTHYSEKVGDQLLEWMVAGEHWLTRKNKEEYFDRITDFYANYDYNDIY